jgi:hypothetical protein
MSKLSDFMFTITNDQKDSLVNHLRIEFSNDKLEDYELMNQIIDLLDEGLYAEAFAKLSTTDQIKLFEEAMFDWDQGNEPNFHCV